YGIADYHLMVGALEDPLAQGLLDTVNVAFLGTRAPSAKQLVAVSPTHHVSANTPPMFIWATAADGLVPVAHSTRMANSLADAGIPFELHIFEEGQHGLSLADQTTAGSILELDADAAQWITLAGNWLRKRFALSIPA
ncbi:MAG: prolyl oligopeptidase family serine peptidase, partial [Anaerolineales bacterium]|nr:prolyl oligopeptidase family serine peptidase [Anaerolineales bacterium]